MLPRWSSGAAYERSGTGVCHAWRNSGDGRVKKDRKGPPTVTQGTQCRALPKQCAKCDHRPTCRPMGKQNRGSSALSVKKTHEWWSGCFRARTRCQPTGDTPCSNQLQTSWEVTFISRAPSGAHERRQPRQERAARVSEVTVGPTTWRG